MHLHVFLYYITNINVIQQIRILDPTPCTQLKLEELDASHNLLHCCYFGKFNPYSGFRSEISIDNNTYCNENGLFTIPLKDQDKSAEMFSTIKRLHLHHNNFTLINAQTLNHLEELQYLDLSNNFLESVRYL